MYPIEQATPVRMKSAWKTKWRANGMRNTPQMRPGRKTNLARPRRNTAEAFYDVFADMPLEDQAAALKILEQVHRLALREKKPTRAPAAQADGKPGGQLPLDSDAGKCPKE